MNVLIVTWQVSLHREMARLQFTGIPPLFLISLTSYRPNNGVFIKETVAQEDPEAAPQQDAKESHMVDFPQLAHTTHNEKQMENRRLQVGRFIAYVGSKSTKKFPFQVGKIVEFDHDQNQVTPFEGGVCRCAPLEGNPPSAILSYLVLSLIFGLPR